MRLHGGGRPILERSTRRALSIVVLVALTLPACAGQGDSGTAAGGDEDALERATYAENGVSFEYPAGWTEFTEQEAEAGEEAQNELWTTSVGVDESDLVGLIAYRLNFAVDERNVDDIGPEITDLVRQIVDDAGATIDSPPSRTEIAGYPAYEADWSGVEVEGEEKSSHAAFLFVDDVEYFFNCQYGPETEEEVLAGCNEILQSFEVTGADGR